MKHQTWTRLMILAVMILFMAGCSISYSSGKSSDSSKSISGSSGSSSKNESEQAVYIYDIREYTRAVALSDRSPDNFMRNIGRIAERHGITDWERDHTTFTAIGSGLKAAGISQKEAASCSFLQGVIAKDRKMMAYVDEGYRS